MRQVDDRDAIEAHLRRAPELHVYELGDLDPFFWPFTRWYGAGDDALDALCLIYDRPPEPTLIALSTEDRLDATRALLAELASELPDRIHAHASPGLLDAIAGLSAIDEPRRHLKMARPADAPEPPDDDDVRTLGPADLDELERFYARSYPDHWFDRRMLETGQYVAARAGGRIAAAAGVHVYSARHRVAALGNVATAPELRGLGLAKRVVGALVRRLTPLVDHVGLNVRADDDVAVALYAGLGFETVAEYDEAVLAR